MKHHIALLLPAMLMSGHAFAAANCLHSSSWQCSHQAGSSTGTTVVTNPPAITPPSVAAPTNTHLGSSTPDHHNVVLLPSKLVKPGIGTQKPGPTIVVTPNPPQVITGTSPGTITSSPGPTITGYSPGMIITPQPPQVIMGYAPATVTPAPAQSFTGISPGYIVLPLPPQTITGYGAVPTPTPMAVPTPTPGAIPTPTPIAVPPKAPPMNVYANPPKTITGTGKVPTPMAQPTIVTAPPKAPPMNVYANPPKTITGIGAVPPKAPPLPVSPNPPQVITGFAPAGPMIIGTPGQGHGPQGPHSLAVHRPPGQHPVTSGEHRGEGKYAFEFIEPGVQNHRVEVYRSKDAKEQVYRDVIPMDAGDFNLTVMGTRRPGYIH